MRLRAFLVLMAGLGMAIAVMVGPTRSSADLGDSVVPTPPDACGERMKKDDGTLWECSFIDEFNGSTVDSTKWRAQDTSLSGMSNGPDGCFVPDPSLMTVQNGTVELSAELAAEPFTCRSPFGDFTTRKKASTLTTWGKFSQAYGRFAFRAKMPETRLPGSHSTLWLYPQGHPYGAWPRSGEVDVAEWFSARPQQVYPSVHYLDGNKNVHTGKDGVISDVSTYHTYVVEWTPTTMQFFFDGSLVFEHSWTPLAPLSGSQPFDKPFTVVLTQAWGQLWNAPVAGTPDRHTMTVDWVRVWK